MDQEPTVDFTNGNRVPKIHDVVNQKIKSAGTLGIGFNRIGGVAVW